MNSNTQLSLNPALTGSLFCPRSSFCNVALVVKYISPSAPVNSQHYSTLTPKSGGRRCGWHAAVMLINRSEDKSSFKSWKWKSVRSPPVNNLPSLGQSRIGCDSAQLWPRRPPGPPHTTLCKRLLFWLRQKLHIVDYFWKVIGSANRTIYSSKWK